MSIILLLTTGNQEICSLWASPNIPTEAKTKIATKIVKLDDKYRVLQKSKVKNNEMQTENEIIFKESLKDLFDITKCSNDIFSSNSDSSSKSYKKIHTLCTPLPFTSGIINQKISVSIDLALALDRT